MRVLKERHFSGTTKPEISEREFKNRELARKAAAEGMVLLKNEGGLLPLEKGIKVALYGVGASRTIKGGTGSGDVNERECISIYQGLKNAGYVITTEDWIHDYDKCYQVARSAWRDDILAKAEKENAVTGFFNVYSSNPFMVPAGNAVEKTDAEVAFYIISRVAGENADRFDKPGDYYLTDVEKKQLSDICAMYPHVVVAVNTGGLADLSFMDEFKNIEALLQIVQPGMEAGNAFADVISGAVTPSGKMTDTWAYQYSDYPNSATFSHNNGNVNKEYYTEGIYVGYRYFDTFDIPVRYGFGFGLSYTSFEIKVLSALLKDDKKTVAVKTEVVNTGDTYSGREVVQAYVTCPTGRLQKEYRRLATFGKTEVLAPGESQKMVLTFTLDQLTSYSENDAAWIMEAGNYVVWIGNSLDSSVPEAVLKLDGEAVLSRTENICLLQEELNEKKADAEKMEAKFAALMERTSGLPVLQLSAAEIETEIVVYKTNAEVVPEEARAFVDTLSTEQLIALASGDPGKGQGSNLGSAGISVPGSAGETNDCALEQNLASIVLADGPAGLRLMKHYNVHEGRIVNKPFMFSLEGGIFCEGMPEDPGETYYQYCTAIPVGTLLAQTWDTALIREVGAMIGGEMETFGVTLWLAPGMNIHRNPLCGRNFEYYSEDPLLSGRIAGAMTDGVQSVPGCGTTIKHFACNNQEDNRMDSDSILSERTLREIYLKGFEIAIKESQPMSIMTSYNLINGVHAANCNDICTKAARCEWGFEGMIMTDWTTTEKGPVCTASGCMRAGNDLVMPGAVCDRENLEQELAEGKLSIEDLKACISRLANIVWQSNQYENAKPYKKN